MTDLIVENVENGRNTNEQGGTIKLDIKIEAYLQELLKEKNILSTSAYPHATRLVQEEVQRIQQSGKIFKDTRYADVYREKPIKVAVKVAVPIREHPKEEELRNSLDPKFSHLSDDLHIEISALAPPAEAQARIAYALAKIRKFLIPDSNDEISMEQLREMENYSEPSAPGRKEKTLQKRPTSVHSVRGNFRGGFSTRGNIFGNQLTAFSNRSSKQFE